MSGQNWELLHIGLVVKDLDKTVTYLERLGGVTTSQVKGPPPGIPVQLKIQHVQLGGVDFELFEQNGGVSPLNEFIEKHGEGVHHIAFSVGEMHQELDEIRTYCTNISEQIPRDDGREDATLESRDMGGIQIQLVKLPADSV